MRQAIILPILLLGCGAASVTRYSDKQPQPIPEGESPKGRACLDAAEAKWEERQRTRSRELLEGNEAAAPTPDAKSVGVLSRSRIGTAASEADLLTTRKIRSALLAEDSFSFEAKNIKILTMNGRVTLRGVVENEREREAIERIAAEIAGSGKIDNQL